jgi:Flp pilus assembly pilin Flp
VSLLLNILTTIDIRLRRQDGEAMAEYAVLIAVIALIVVVAAVVLGQHISMLATSRPKAH